jgi:hypothetical protein
MLSLKRVEEPKPLSIHALKQFIAKALDKGWIRESFHSGVERAYRNISDDDLRYGLESDWTLEEARYSEEHDGFTYELKTVDFDDVELHIVICPMLGNQTLKVITKW